MTENKENTLVLETSKGNVEIEMFADVAPKHVAQIKALVREGAYDNVVFHRVIDGFMAQTGDVKFGKKDSEDYDVFRLGMGGSDKEDIEAEFSSVPHKRGTVSMARSAKPNSANSQFFICFEDAPFLNGDYSVWGQVVKGMENVDKLERGEPVKNPDYIIKAYLLSDDKEQK